MGHATILPRPITYSEAKFIKYTDNHEYMTGVTGNLLFFQKKYLQEEKGDDDYEAVLSRMTEDTREVMRSPLLSNKMYDVKVVQDLLKSVYEIYGRDEIRKMGYYAFDRHFKGFYGILLSFTSMEKIIKRLPSMWKKSYTEGSLEGNHDEGTTELRITGMDFPEPHLYGVIYYLQAAVEAISKKKVTMRHKKVKEKEYLVTFTEV